MRVGNAPPYWDEAKDFLRKIDPVISNLIDCYEHPNLVSRGDIFYTLARSIVGQQISSKAAESIWSRIEEKAGKIGPESMIFMGHDELRECGLSNRKAEYIIGASESWSSDYSNESLGGMSDGEVVQVLTSLRGVGTWTAEMILIFSLLRSDVFPMADIGAIRAMEKLYNQGRRMEKEDISSISGSWRPFRTVATWYLWRSMDSEPVLY